MNDLMIDLETAGSTPGSAILTIAAVWFDARAEPTEAPRGFSDTDPNILYERVSLASCLAAGLTVDADTLSWWMQQSADARREAFDASLPRLNLAVMLNNLAAFLTPAQRQYGRIWSHGSCFDIPIVEAAFRALARPIVWQYWNIRDTRTLYEAAGIERTKPPLAHHAVYDAFAQIHDVQRAYQKLAPTGSP